MFHKFKISLFFYYDGSCFSIYQAVKRIPVSNLRDLYADIYETKMGHPRGERKLVQWEN